MSRRPILLGVAALLALIAAFCTDAPVASFVHQRHWDAKHPGLLAHVREIIKLAGFFPTTLLLGIAITAIHPARWRAGLFLILAALPAALNEPMKWIAGRFRPYKGIDDAALVRPLPFDWHPLSLPLRAIVHPPPNLSFPSGHTALAFATAAALSILFSRGRWIWFCGAAVVGIERVTENAHWTSDAVCGALLGLIGVTLVARAWPKTPGRLTGLHG